MVSEIKETEEEFISIAKTQLLKDIDSELFRLKENEELDELNKLSKKLSLQIHNAGKTLSNIEDLFSNEELSNFNVNTVIDNMHEHFHKLFQMSHIVSLRSMSRLSHTARIISNCNFEGRSPYTIAVHLLEIFYISNKNEFRVEWVREFFLQENQLKHYISNHSIQIKSEIKLPTPSSDNSLNWVYKFKETLERNVFSVDSPQIKKSNDAEYLAEKSSFYNYLEKKSETSPYKLT